MAKISTDSRAYINPAGSMTETLQRAEISRCYGTVAEWYVESRSVKRADFFKHLRPGSIAVVAWTANLAQPRGRKMDRVADLMDARGEVHAKGAILVEASTGLRSDRDWPKMKAAAIPMLGRLAQGARSALNGTKGKPALAYTNAEIKTLLRIAESRRYKNWDQRKVGIKAEGIVVPGRTWFNEKLAVVARARGLEL